MSTTKPTHASNDSAIAPAVEGAPVTCPRCGCQLIGIETPCADPSAHQAKPAAIEPTRVYGGQLRTCYRIDRHGIIWVPFRRWDGVIREYPCFWPFYDPVTGEKLPWMIALPYLESPDLAFVTGLSPSAFNGASATFPGRWPGTRRVKVETTSFVREYIFGTLTRVQRWRPTTRREKRARHRTDCRKGCRKRHC